MASLPIGGRKKVRDSCYGVTHNNYLLLFTMGSYKLQYPSNYFLRLIGIGNKCKPTFFFPFLELEQKKKHHFRK